VITSIKAVLVWSLQVCVLTQYHGGKTSVMILEKQLLLPSICKGLYGHFPNNLKSIILIYNKED